MNHRDANYHLEGEFRLSSERAHMLRKSSKRKNEKRLHNSVLSGENDLSSFIRYLSSIYVSNFNTKVPKNTLKCEILIFYSHRDTLIEDIFYLYKLEKPVFLCIRLAWRKSIDEPSEKLIIKLQTPPRLIVISFVSHTSVFNILINTINILTIPASQHSSTLTLITFTTLINLKLLVNICHNNCNNSFNQYEPHNLCKFVNLYKYNYNSHNSFTFDLDFHVRARRGVTHLKIDTSIATWSIDSKTRRKTHWKRTIRRDDTRQETRPDRKTRHKSSQKRTIKRDEIERETKRSYRRSFEISFEAPTILVLVNNYMIFLSASVLYVCCESLVLSKSSVNNNLYSLSFYLPL